MGYAGEAIERSRGALYEYHPDELALWLWCNRAWFEGLDKVAQDYIVRDSLGRVGSTVAVIGGRVVKMDKRLGMPGLVNKAARCAVSHMGLDLWVDKGNSQPCVVYVTKHRESALGFRDFQHRHALVLRPGSGGAWVWRPLWGLRRHIHKTAQGVSAAQMDTVEILCKRLYGVTGGLVRPAPRHDIKWDYDGMRYATVPDHMEEANRDTTSRWRNFCWEMKRSTP